MGTGKYTKFKQAVGGKKLQWQNNCYILPTATRDLNAHNKNAMPCKMSCTVSCLILWVRI